MLDGAVVSEKKGILDLPIDRLNFHASRESKCSLALQRHMKREAYKSSSLKHQVSLDLKTTGDTSSSFEECSP